MLWENRLSFHNLLSISGGKKVENYWEIFEGSAYEAASNNSNVNHITV